MQVRPERPQGCDSPSSQSRKRIERLLREKWRNDEAHKSALAQSNLEGRQRWLAQGTMGVPYNVDDMRPKTMRSEARSAAE